MVQQLRNSANMQILLLMILCKLFFSVGKSEIRWYIFCVHHKNSTVSQNVTLQVIQPAAEAEAVCPGEDIILTCRISSMPQPMSVPPTLNWRQTGFPYTSYYNGAPLSVSFGDFNSTAYFSDDNYIIVSNVTLINAALIHNDISISCYSFPSPDIRNRLFKIAGKYK